MITPEEATQIILSSPFKFQKETIPLLQSQGRTLDEDIHADSDLPPFDRVMMDGVAFNVADWNNGCRSFAIVGIQKAGDPKMQLSGSGNCLEVMTGTVCPDGCNVVVPYEQVQITNNNCLVLQNNLEANQHIQKRGTDKKQNDVLIHSGRTIMSPEIGIGASVGKSGVVVRSLPRVHIFSTGEELVELNTVPEAHQIRRSNVFALQQLLLSMGIISTESHLPDVYEVILDKTRFVLETNDVVLLTGGVSKGKFDLIPSALKDLGVSELFHRISQKPGKPMWFGRTEKTTVFAFPGNPVSTFMCAVRYLLPWLRLSIEGKDNKPLYAKLNITYQNKTSLTFFQLVKIEINHLGELIAHPIASGGSGDFTSLSHADGFVEVPAGSAIHEKGAAMPLHLFRSII